MNTFTLKVLGLQADASRPSTQVCVEIFDKGDGDRHAGEGYGSDRAARPTRPSNSRSLRPHRLGPMGPKLVNSPVNTALAAGVSGRHLASSLEALSPLH